MPAYLRAVPGTNTLYATIQANVWDRDDSALYDARYGYQRRGQKTRLLPSWGRWPTQRGMGFYTDPANAACMVMSQCMTGNPPGEWEPWNGDGAGTPSQKFIIGTCKDEASATVSGAIVQIFRTADDGYVGETTSDSNGRYEAGTPHAGAQHYLVAYRAGSPDIAGTTVNTLVPTNRDGT